MLANQKSAKFFSLFADIILLNFCFLLSAIFAQSFETYLAKPQIIVLQFLSNILWIFSTGQQSGISRKFSTAALQIFGGVIFQIFFAVFYIFFVKENLFTRNFIIYYSTTLTFALLVKQFVFQRSVQSAVSKGKFLKKAAIVGTGKLAKGFAKKIAEDSSLGYQFVGFISPDTVKSDNVLGDFSQLPTIIDETGIEEIIIALSVNDNELIEKILRICDNRAVKTYIIPDYAQYLSQKFSINSMGEYPIITVRNNPLEEFQNRFIKRTVDFSIALVATILVLTWLIPLISILIRLTSRGNALFIQSRFGRNDKVFQCWKFRTMYSHKEGEKIRKVTNENDPRITPVGRFLRRTNLDEIPQIINVLTGSMSLVGPRPHAVNFHKNYEEFIEEIKLRHRVKPGITGWAQIHGYRGDAVAPEQYQAHIKKRIDADIWYIENWSLKLDIQIIFETIWQMFSGKNKGT